MRMKTIVLRSLALSLLITLASVVNVANAQVDTTKAAQPDTLLVTPADTEVQEKGQEKEKVDRKRRDEFIAYAGINFNRLKLPEGDFEATTELGYHFGASYKRGKFFYWQIGARFNGAKYGVRIMDETLDTAYTLTISDIDIPITGGINFLSVTNRILALRVFVSAVPAFTLSVGDNDFEIGKDDINSFMFYAQGGIGVNVAFFLLEAGYNYGFDNLFEDDTASKPGQIFINLGFRF